MSLKLLIAACCLMAAVQARPPKPPTSTCSAACVSRTFWTGYQVGKVYTYEFDQTVELTSELSRTQAGRLRMTGLAKVEVHSDCEMALSVELKQARVGDIADADALTPREPPAKVAEALRLPLRFAFENGQVTQLCPSPEETRASLNFKRGLLSQLQVSTEQRGQAHQLEERDILGDCWTEYTPEGQNTLLKSKDLSKCKLNYQAYPLTGVKSFDDESPQSKQPITKGSLKCRMEIDAERDILKETVCTEEQIQSADHTPESIDETIRTNARLTLKSESSGLVNALQEVTKRTDLRHAHKTSRQCHSSSAWLEEDLFHAGNECVERSHGAKTSTEYKAQAKKTLEELCEDTKAAKGMSRTGPKKYADLIKYLRSITEQEDLNQLYSWVRDGYCSENPLLKTIVRSAIPTVGTKQSVALILDQLSKSELDSAHRGNWLIDGIALMQHPTADILPELLSYVRKRRSEAMLGVTRDEPLALSAVVHKVCQELPNCEAEPKVKAVIDYFSDSLGPACEQFSTDSDNAFVALLSVGNMGRVAGGAAALTRCAASSSLPQVYRVFALHSLRRFDNFSAEAQNQLVDLMINSALDSELRIAAYQALSRHGFSQASRLYEAVRNLLDATDDDRQVQMFVYTHLKNLRGEAARQTAPLLEAAKLTGELDRLGRHQYSNSLRTEYFSDALAAGVQAEVPIVFSAQSAIPRYIGLNLTVNLPSQGQSVNLMEVGVRMQGLEQLVEELYSSIAKKFGKEPTKRESSGRQEVATPEQNQSELTAEQRESFGQTSTEPRIDLLVRRYGAEISHSDISGGFLKSLPDVVSKSSDYNALFKMMAPASGSEPMGVSAGTLAENTLAIPTITGLPILVKNEMHYLTNLRIDSKIRALETAAESTLELKPAAAVMMSRTVAVDAIFERTGIQTSTSFLTSTGLRLSVTMNYQESADRKFAFKAEPLVKRQQLADAQTEVNFFQHTAGKVHVEKPLVPQQASVKHEKCTEGFYKKYVGHKICYKTDYLPSCKRSLRSFSQCPGSYQLFVEKDDDFGAYEVSFSLKNQDKIKQLQILVGDQKSTDRLVKFNAQYVSQGDKSNYKLELLNPIFPIVLDSSLTKDREGYQIYTEMKAGSVDYVATGTVQPQSEKGIMVNGEFYPKVKPAQKLKVSLEYNFNGFSFLLLPLAATKLQVKMHTGNQLSLEYSLQHEASSFAWQMSSQYKTNKGDVTSMRYRVQYSNRLEESTEASTFLYDFEVQNPKGNNLTHSLHTKVIRRIDGGNKQTTASINHKLQYGTEKKRSPIDCEARISLKEATENALFKVTGDGEVTHFWSGESFTAKLENLKIQVGEAVDQTDGFGKQYLYAINYGIKIEEVTADYQVELRHLQWRRWSLTKQAVELKAKATLGPKSYSAQLKHALNGETRQAWQIIKMEYNEYVKFHLNHRMQKAEGTDSVKSEFYLQSTDGSKVQAKWGLTWPEENTVNCDFAVDVNGKKVLGCRHTLRYTGTPRDHQFKHEMTLETPPSSYSVETSARISRQSASDFANFLNYQERLITGRYRPGRSLWLLATLLRDLRVEQSSKMVGPTPTQRVILENVFDMDNWSNGIVLKNLLQVTVDSKDVLNYGLTITRSRQYSDSPSWTMKNGVKFEVNAMDQRLQTEVESTLSNDRLSLKFASKDTLGWHDIKVSATSNAQTANRWETILKLEGQISRKSITSSLNITCGWDDARTQHNLIVTLLNPESNIRVRINMVPSPLKVTASMSLDGDFGLLPVKEMKATAEYNFNHGISFESKAEIEGTQIVSAKLQIANKVFVADLKTAHPKMREAGIKIVLDTDIPEAVKCSTIVKFVGLTRKMQIKKTGTATLSFNSPVYNLLFGLTGDMEFEGLEGYINYKKLEYELLLKKKPGMEFQFVTSINSPDRTSSKQPMLYLASTLNYWPFKAELKAKANNYKGWDLKYGAGVEVDYQSAFAGIEFQDEEVSATYDIQDQPGNFKRVNIRVKCSLCTDKGRDLVAGHANMTWPLKLSEFELGLETEIGTLKLQSIDFRFVHRPNKKQVLAAFHWDGRTQKLIDCTYTQTEVGRNTRGEALLHSDLRFFLGPKARAMVQASYQFGRDKELTFRMKLAGSDEEVIMGSLFWLSVPRSYEAIPETNVDWGFQLNGMGVNVYGVHIPKTDKSCKWRLSADLPSLRKPITAWLDVDDSKVKSGKISAFDHEILLSSNPESGVQVTLRTSSDETKTLRVKWSSRYESLQDMKGKLEIEADGKTSIYEMKAQPQQIVFNYGRSTAPNTLKIEYEVSDITSLWAMTADLKISHETDAAKNSELILLPGYRVPMPTTRYPFKLTVSTKAALRLVTITFESVSLGVKNLFYKHDFAAFPRLFNFQSLFISAESSRKVWDMAIQVDSFNYNAQLMCQIGEKFLMSFKDAKYKLQLENVIDLQVQLPNVLSSDDSDKKELIIQLTLPVLKIEERICLKATLQGLTEGQQLKVKYGRGEDDQIVVWSLTSRKFGLTPKFEIDLETSLTSKNALLGSWEIRSVEARLESSLQRSTESDSYIIMYKETVKINGDDLMTKVARLDGKNNALPNKGELTVTGHVECALKFDLGRKDKPAKIQFSLEKIGQSRDKYSLKLDITPSNANYWWPDFTLKTECPHRQFVIGKESKLIAEETTVTLQFYLNKRQNHGATFVYKVDQPTSGTPKYTVEVDLPTRKIRAVWQPEMTKNKFGVMTTFDWDADKSSERILGLDARVDFSTDAMIIVECKAPFLTKRVRIEGRLESKVDGWSIQMKHMSGDRESQKIKVDYSYQRQAETDVARFTLETTGAVESKFSLSAQARDEIENFRRSRFDGTLEIKISTMEKRIKFVYRPMREITVTCDHGAALSLKYTSDKLNLHQLVLFVADNEKSAARFKLVFSKPSRKITAKLDIGTGSFSHNLDLRGPNYRPETVLLRAEMRRENLDMSAHAFFGKMTVGQKLNPFDAASAVPGHLSFFAIATRAAEYNKMKFSVNWRTPSDDKMEAAVTSLKSIVQRYLSEPAAQAVSLAFEHLQSVRCCSAPGVNAAWFSDEIASLASNDFDKLSRYCERALNDNEFYLRHIVSGAKVVGRVAERCLVAAKNVAATLKEKLDNLQISENIIEATKQVWKAVANLLSSIPFQGIWQAVTKYAEEAFSLGSYWYEVTVQKLGAYYRWVYAVATDPSGSRAVLGMIQQTGEYLNSLYGNAKDAVAQMWGQVRSIAGASFVAMKTPVTDDLLPMAVNHLDDFKTFKELYDNVMLELRIWYDTGATPEERTALTRTSRFLNYFYSEDMLKTIEGMKFILQGDFVEGLKKLCGDYSFTVWRPRCDSACQRGETFAAIEGFFYRPSYTLSWPMASAPGVVLRRIGSKLMRKGLPESFLASALLGSSIGAWNPIDRLLAIRHRTAVISSDNHLITFDGLALTTERPCSYLVAREFPRGLFSVVQEYRKVEGRQSRDRLRIRFGSARVIVERDGTVQVNDKAERLPLRKTTEDGKNIEAIRSGDLLTVRFHGSMRDTLVLRCSSVADSCVISVHPLYHGSVYGLAGSNDGRRDNEIHQGDAKKHIKFWTAGQCAAEGSASVSVPQPESSGSNDCFAWFRQTNSPVADCFNTVDPRPYLAVCQQQERTGRDPCKAARQYADRCNSENVRVDTPAKCIACRLDSEGEVKAPGLVTDKAALQKRIQVVFLVESSACSMDAAGTSGSRLRSLATAIDRLKTSNPNVKSIQFGLAHFGGSDSAASLTSIPMDMSEDDKELSTNRRFGSLAELTAALSRLQPTTGADDKSSVDVLRAIADLPTHYQWQPLAQKHLVVVSCKPCTARTWSYGNLFAKALKSVKDQVFVHTISKNAIRPERISPDFVGYDTESFHLSDWSSARMDSLGTAGVRRFASECSAELATEADSTAKGSVWRLDKFAAGGDDTNQVVQLLVTKEIQRRLEKPDCRQCACSSDQRRQRKQSQLPQPWCRVVTCDTN